MVKTLFHIMLATVFAVMPVHAGMTVITLTDVAKARLESISFFCAVYLLLALGVRLIWNYLAGAFEWMPRINYRRALALMLVSGLFLYVVLTMVSGARELLTPGAWKKHGIGYELNTSGKVPGKSVRQASMKNLKAKLWSYARTHDGKLPHGIFDETFGIHHWALPGVAGYYAYLPAKSIGGGRKVLVYEPSVMGSRRIVLLTDGSVEAWDEKTLRRALSGDE